LSAKTKPIAVVIISSEAWMKAVRKDLLGKTPKL
jgi:hypothetical protein